MTEFTSDWDAAFATLCPFPEEVEQERAYWREQDRIADVEAYEVARAEENACTEEEFEDWDPEPPAAPAARRPERPSKIDGLTKSERRRLYDPAAYDVSTPDEVNFAVVNRENGAAF